MDKKKFVFSFFGVFSFFIIGFVMMIFMISCTSSPKLSSGDDQMLKQKLAQAIKERDELSLQLAQLKITYNIDDQKIKDENDRMTSLENELKAELADLISTDSAHVYRYGGELVVDISEVFLFEPDKANLKASFSDRLIKLSNILKKATDKIIRVEGHTAADVPSIWPSSWDLAAMRAVNVVRFMQEKAGINPQGIVAISCGEFRPIALNDTDANRKKNRRVSMVLVDRALYAVKDLQLVY